MSAPPRSPLLDTWGFHTLLAGRDSEVGACHVTHSDTRLAPLPQPSDPARQGHHSSDTHSLHSLSHTHAHICTGPTTSDATLTVVSHSHNQTLKHTQLHTFTRNLKLTHVYTHTCTHTHTFAPITSSTSPTLIHIHIHILKHFGRLNCTLKIHVHPESDMEIHSSQI